MLSDFGLAEKALDSHGRPVKMDSLTGTPCFWAPECLMRYALLLMLERACAIAARLLTVSVVDGLTSWVQNPVQLPSGHVVVWCTAVHFVIWAGECSYSHVPCQR